ncbi:inorganic pyrophosphatase/exopolyphosphatase [Longilinea arvoryzae]|uniref:inorganic diphosphatase n=1 Tax=Longilinea arvoryzae TaxID=360412 RepID=A0A0S7BAY4_9CHLR|nr:DHHA2 domain-containing protein [Longilinea arvoryzae]GAP14702.1 inorganic pyrophosphatase/exopolyphosphatase [Longilinea arvoryzae]
MQTPIYVIGHVNPDTDSIAAAASYAWLLRERDGLDTIAARAGATNAQTSWVLKYLGMEAPILLNDASPRFESVMRRFDTTLPEKPLRDAWSVASRTGGIAPLVNLDGTPFGLVNGRSLFEFLFHLVGPHPKQQEARISEILEYPCNLAADTKVAKFQASTRIRDVITRILREEGDEFIVTDDEGHYVGVCRQRDLLNPPRLKIVLVDHNEVSQAVGSLDEAELLEILDHHRLGNPSTRTPIRFSVDIVGSTSTLVSERIEDAGLSAPPLLAGLMLAGLLSDTLILASPTTTERDRLAADRLARWAFVGGSVLANETIRSYGEKVLAAGAGLGARAPSEIVSSDMKIYRSGGFQFAVAQAEVSNLFEISEHLEALTKALEALREQKGLDFAMLMVTDVVRGTSRLLVANQPPLLEDLPYPPQTDGTRLAEGVVSRKKQLLPVVLGLLER